MERFVNRFDDQVIEAVTGADHGPLRPVLAGAARAADVLLPWASVSTGLVVSGTPGTRLALVRGWSAMAASALVENVVLKPLVHRRRPAAQRFPADERRHTDPSTSAFPSGHVGAAFAFPAATWADVPRFRTPLLAIAATTLYARVFTGRHYLTDALVGAAVGAAIGVVVQRLGGEATDGTDRDAR